MPRSSMAGNYLASDRSAPKMNDKISNRSTSDWYQCCLPACDCCLCKRIDTEKGRLRSSLALSLAMLT
eukprot:3296271-Pleurochrysis_carterae.AAC.2